VCSADILAAFHELEAAALKEFMESFPNEPPEVTARKAHARALKMETTLLIRSKGLTPLKAARMVSSAVGDPLEYVLDCLD
jgi:hypothetical protein